MAKKKLDPELQKLAKKIVAFRKRLGLAEDAELRAAHNWELALQATAKRRLELGQELCKVRPRWPERGPNAKGWGEFLRVVGLKEEAARVAMRYAEFVTKQISQGRLSSQGKLPTLFDAGLETRADEAEADESERPDRDTWCTPREIADVLGTFGLDPCSNERSHISSVRRFLLERDEDGLKLAAGVPATERVFINPPYSDVPPWVAAYKHTRFCFLLKFDTSTKWFAELIAATELVLFPKGTRIEFEAPPGVESSSNQFPHGLFFARAEDATPEIRAQCFEFMHKP